MDFEYFFQIFLLTICNFLLTIFTISSMYTSLIENDGRLFTATVFYGAYATFGNLFTVSLYGLGHIIIGNVN